MLDTKFAISACLIGAMLLMPIGCGSGSSLDLGRVEGTVTFGGKPLEHGRVVFSPEKGTTGPQAVGNIQSDGSFRMQTGQHDGVPLGKHVVTVHCRQKPTPEQERDMAFIPKSLIPDKYSKGDQTPLRFEVTGSNDEYSIEIE